MRVSTPRPRSRAPEVVVEIGNEWLKIARVERAQGGVSFSRVHLMKADSGESALGAALSAVLDQWKVGRASVLACLPRQAANIRLLELPSTDPSEIADMVDLQAGKQTPYSQDEIVSTYRIIGAGREGYTRIMLVIVQRPALRQRFALLEDAGIDVGQMTVSTEAVLNWQRQSGAGGPGAFALLDVDSGCSDFMVFSPKGLVFTRSILIGANQMLGDFDKWKEKFAREVKQSLDTCLSESPGLSVTKLLLTGAGVHIPTLVTYLGPQLGLQPECIDSLQSLKRLPATPSLQDPAYHGISLTALAGLAVRSEELQLNLIPDSVSTRRALVKKAQSLTLLAMLLMTAIVCGAIYAVTKVALLAGQLGAVRGNISAMQSMVKQDEQMREVIRLVNVRSESGLSPVVLLREIQTSKPANVYVDALDFNYEQNQVMISGTAEAIKDVRAFVQNLEQKAVFKDVAEGQTKKTPDGAFKFQIACALEVRK